MSNEADTERDRKRRHRQTLSLSAIVSILVICGAVLPTAGVISAPFFIGWLSDAMADEIKGQVKTQVTPVTAGFKVLIQSTIAELEDDISQMEFRRDNNPASWSAADAQELTTKRRRLRSQRAALEAIESAEKEVG